MRSTRRPGRAGETDQWGFRYDAYVSYVDRDPDATWCGTRSCPTWSAPAFGVAVSGDVEEPGVARVVGIERGISQSRRTVVVLARLPGRQHGRLRECARPDDGDQRGTYRVLPVRITDLDAARAALPDLHVVDAGPGSPAPGSARVGAAGGRAAEPAAAPVTAPGRPSPGAACSAISMMYMSGASSSGCASRT